MLHYGVLIQCSKPLEHHSYTRCSQLENETNRYHHDVSPQLSCHHSERHTLGRDQILPEVSESRATYVLHLLVCCQTPQQTIELVPEEP